MKSAQDFINIFEKRDGVGKTIGECVDRMRNHFKFSDEEIEKIAQEIDEWFDDPDVPEEEKNTLRCWGYLEYISMRRRK